MLKAKERNRESNKIKWETRKVKIREIKRIFSFLKIKKITHIFLNFEIRSCFQQQQTKNDEN